MSATETEPDQALAALAERYWRFRCTESPISAVMAGEKVDGVILLRETPADYDRRREGAAAMLSSLNAIRGEDLSVRDRATQSLLRRELCTIIDFHAVGAHLRPPMFPVGPEYATVSFADATTLVDAASARLYRDRLATLPAYLQDLQSALLAGQAAGFRYPRVVLTAAANNLRAMLTGPVETLAWFGPFRRVSGYVADQVDAVAAQASRLLAETVIPAFAAHADFLETVLASSARVTLGCADDLGGIDLYRALSRYYTTTDLTPANIHALGLAEVARLEAEMDTLADASGCFGGVASWRDAMTADPAYIAPSAEALQVQVAGLAKRIDGLIPAYFGHVPRMTYGVEIMPAAASAAMPPAYAQPNPPDRSRPGIFFLNGLPEKCPSYMHVPLTLHEAWPGHLMHLALMQEMQAVPTFLRHVDLGYSAFLEGWALYCEGLGVDMGLYETPEQHFGRLDMEMWRAVRLVVDTGLHAMGWDRDTSIDYMAARLSLARSVIVGEVDRYIALPAQALSYQIGNLKLRALRRRGEDRLGDRFRLRDFHDAVMAVGAVTLPVLDDLIEDWLTRQKDLADAT